jgi:hypothetical protein
VRITLANPLSVGLAHYTRTLTRTLEECGADVERLEVPEPSASRHGRSRWLLSYLEVLRTLRARTRPDLVILTWPAGGYWDLLAARALVRGGVWIVFHDPDPLVHARGYGRFARWSAALGPVKAAVLSHSAAATEALLPAVDHVEFLPHPMLPPQRRRRANTEGKLVRVLGQYKADRDLEALAEIAHQAPADWTLEVFGQGWSEIPGWRVESRFLLEEEFDDALAASDVVVVPYQRFFQSGVAIRSLERGSPVVGPATSSLADMLGADSPWLVHDSDWVSAIRRALQTKDEDVSATASRLYGHTLAMWCAWLEAQPISN